MITVYFDDSGTHPESDVAVAACYVGEVDQWRALERDWQGARTAEGFEVFGMADILGGKEKFRDWPEEKRDRLIRRLISVMQIRSRKGFSYSVVKSEYDAVMTEQLKKRIGRFHYSFAVRGCLAAIANWRREFDIIGPMEYVFDQMSQGKGEIEAILNELIHDGDGEIFGLETGGWAFQSKKSLAPLQGIDILAHESYRHMVSCIVSPKPVPHSLADSYMWELHQGPLTTGFYTKDLLVKIANGTAQAFDRIGWGEPLTNAKGPRKRESFG